MLAWFIYSTLGRNFLPLWSICCGNYNNPVVALLLSLFRVPLFALIYYLLLHLGFCKAYQNCLVALIKITTVYFRLFFESISFPINDRKKIETKILSRRWCLIRLPVICYDGCKYCGMAEKKCYLTNYSSDFQSSEIRDVTVNCLKDFSNEREYYDKLTFEYEKMKKWAILCWVSFEFVLWFYWWWVYETEEYKVLNKVNKQLQFFVCWFNH